MSDSSTTSSPAHTYKFHVSMSCGGCSGAIERVLKKLDGVQSYTVDLKSETAEVKAEESLSYDTVLKAIKKTGKKVNEGRMDGEIMNVE